MAENLLTPAFNVFEHMALDEALAHRAPGVPVLRFYHWVPGPAVTFGYAQCCASVRAQAGANAGPLCRRPTGGGMVFHGADLTFSLVFENALAGPKEIYARLHGAVERALAEQNLLHSVRRGPVPAGAYALAQNGAPAGCFANPVQDDLISGGRKILGGAIRRFGSVVLYQGSLQCAGARENPAFRRAVARGAAQMLGTDFQTAAADADLLSAARESARAQYASAAWTEKF